MVRVPCPISVLATRIRTPVLVSSSAASDASITSPPPVNPAPWKKSESPIPRRVPAQARRLRAKSVLRTASRNTARALQSRPSFCPVAVVSPGRSAFLSRSRTGSMRSCSAIRSMWASIANCVWGAPNPRKAPFGGVFVWTTRPFTSTWSHR
jgi:hypothetical protein